ncbi:AAA family ATPase [Priestia aryabhattai]|uniref:AAA family ATPase n=1 Tax=Priestia aryabhattai TaxID=412384 RepID=UPI001C8E8784|nr:SMC family ATPase [Priestia aryabhattai]MBX9987157.1 SMC family ATPase [Priestia aryabhattai]
MKIEKVIINNFRNYAGKHVFDLTKDITIFYGDNGFGKSSFFDALEWCISGTISRFTSSIENENFKQDIINRYIVSNNENGITECSVSIGFDGKFLVRKFKVDNSLYGNIQVKITNEAHKTLKNTEQQLVNSKERVDEFLSNIFAHNVGFQQGLFGKLMKQTYILSQDQVTEFVTSDDPAARFRSIANIMGFKPLLNLSDNTKKIYSRFNSEYQRVKEELNIINQSIVSKKEAKMEADIYKLNNELKLLSIDINSDISHELEKLKNTAFTSKIEFRRLLILCKDIKEKFTNINDLYENQEVLKGRKKEINNKLDKYRTLQKRLQERIQKINIQSKNLEGYQRTLKETKELESSINPIQPFIMPDNQSLKSQVEKNMRLQKVYEYAFLNYKQYNEYIRICNSSPDNLLKLEKKLSRLKKWKEKRLRIVNSLSDKLIQSQNGVISNLLHHVKGIHEYVEKQSNNGICPVCSSNQGDNLSVSIEKNLEYYSQKANSASAYIQKILSLREAVLNNIKNIDSKIQSVNSQKLTIEMAYNTARPGLRKIKDSKLFDIELMEKELSILKNLIESNEKETRKTNDIINKVVKLRELYEKNDLLRGKIDLNLPLEINKRLLRLRRADNRLNAYIERLSEEIINLKEKISLLEEKFKQFVTLTSQLSIDKTKSFNELIDILYRDINAVDVKLKHLTDLMSKFNVIKQNTRIEKQINELKVKRETLENEIERIEKVMHSLSEYTKDIFGQFGDNAKDYLNQYNSPIQKYFRYLNPLPTRSLVKFEGEDEKLWVKVIFDEKNADTQKTSAKNILSSGQLNVLAISIFLAMNESQRIHDLDFIAIDDPIQNMDDINQFSICDVLGSIDKQVIFSTHDFEFVKLFVKKNEHKKKDIQVYNFKSPYLTPDKIEHILF